MKNIENVSTLQIHKLTQEQYNQALVDGEIQLNAIYLTPDDDSNVGRTTEEGGEIFNDYENNYATAPNAHAEGLETGAEAPGAHAEGIQAIAQKTASHAEGLTTMASGQGAHAEGGGTVAIGYYSHTEGHLTTSTGEASHAEGKGKISCPHEIKQLIENEETTPSDENNKQIKNLWEAQPSNERFSLARGKYSHIEGDSSLAIGEASHTEGSETIAYGSRAHAEGRKSKALGKHSHAQNYDTLAAGEASHAEGTRTKAYQYGSHAEGMGTEAGIEKDPNTGVSQEAVYNPAHAEGLNTKAIGYASHTEGQYNEAEGTASHAEGSSTTAKADYSHVEGIGAKTYDKASHAEGAGTVAGSKPASAPDTDEGDGGNGDITDETGKPIVGLHAAHAEGMLTTASGMASHSEGYDTTANGTGAHAEGYDTTASGMYSHAEGESTQAIAQAAHAEGLRTIAMFGAHAEGANTQALGSYSHTEGAGTIAKWNYQHIQGKYNKEGDYACIVGNGADDNNRSNAHTLDWDGNAWFAGDVRVGGYDYSSGRKLQTAPEVINISIKPGIKNQSINGNWDIDTTNQLYYYDLENQYPSKDYDISFQLDTSDLSRLKAQQKAMSQAMLIGDTTKNRIYSLNGEEISDTLYLTLLIYSKK